MSDTLLFAADKPTVEQDSEPPWKVLVVDDEDSIHKVTQLVLKNLSFDSRPVQLIEARSAAEARTILKQEGTDIALALVDVTLKNENTKKNQQNKNTNTNTTQKLKSNKQTIYELYEHTP